MAAKSDIEHWQINATVHSGRVEEIHYITDAVRNIRQKPRTVVWQTERLLGRGAYGEVRLEKQRESDKVRAVKKIATTTALDNTECERELKALLEFSKPKYKEAGLFVDFLGWFQHSSEVFIAMEYVQLGDLEANLKALSEQLPQIEAKDITRQILQGLQIMHAESFAHRDLKPQNVLVVHGSPEWWIKLADFGLSKRLTEATAYYTKSGTQFYMAPEMYDLPEYTNAVDLWAVGCIIYRMVSGVVPFLSVKSQFKYCGDRSLFPLNALSDAKIQNLCINFIRELLDPRPEKRPSAAQALNSEWLSLGPQSIYNDHTPHLDQQIPESQGSTSPSGVKQQDINSIQPIERPNGPDIGVTQSIAANVEDFLAPRPIQVDFQHSRPASEATVYNTGAHPGLKTYPADSSPNLAKYEPYQPLTNVDSSLSQKGLSLEGETSQHTVKPGPSKIMQLESGTPSSPSELSAESSLSIVRHEDTAGIDLDQYWRQELVVLQTLKEPKVGVLAMAFSKIGSIFAVGGLRDEVHIWRLNKNSKLPLSYTGRFGDGGAPVAADFVSARPMYDLPLTSLQFPSNNCEVTGISGDDMVIVWNWAAQRRMYSTRCSRYGTSHTIALSPMMDLYASCSVGYPIDILDMRTGDFVEKLGPNKSRVTSLCFSANGRQFASGSADGVVKLWNLCPGFLDRRYWGHTGVIQILTFSLDGNFLASGSKDKTVRIWDLRRYSCVQILTGHLREILLLAFSPDGTILASLSGDGVVRIWNVANGAAIKTLQYELTEVILSMAFSPDGDLLAIGTNKQRVYIWGAPR